MVVVVVVVVVPVPGCITTRVSTLFLNVNGNPACGHCSANHGCVFTVLLKQDVCSVASEVGTHKSGIETRGVFFDLRHRFCVFASLRALRGLASSDLRHRCVFPPVRIWGLM